MKQTIKENSTQVIITSRIKGEMTVFYWLMGIVFLFTAIFFYLETYHAVEGTTDTVSIWGLEFSLEDAVIFTGIPLLVLLTLYGFFNRLLFRRKYGFWFFFIYGHPVTLPRRKLVYTIDPQKGLRIVTIQKSANE